jgi:hypothetical protein
MELTMRSFLFALVLLFYVNNIAHADCQIEFDKTKNEGHFNLRTDAGKVPRGVKGYPEAHYTYNLVASWTYYNKKEPQAKDPRIYLFDQKTCETVKIVDLYPKGINMSGGEYYGVSFNQPLGLIYVTSRATGRTQHEVKRFRYTEIYSYDDLSLLTRLENETPLSNAEFIDDGKEVIGFDYSKRQIDGTQIVMWSAEDLNELRRSNPIGKSEFEKLGIQFSRSDIVITYFEEQWFKDKGHNVKFEDQYGINFRGKDTEGNYRSVAFTLKGQPLLTVWRENGKAVVGYPSDYEKKFNLKINPLQFKDTQSKKEESKIVQEAVKKKPISPEPVPVVEPYTKSPSIEEQIAQNRAAKAAREQQEKQQKQEWLFYIGLAILAVIAIAAAICLLQRSRQK